jgi:hypothetical protein
VHRTAARVQRRAVNCQRIHASGRPWISSATFEGREVIQAAL